MPLIIRNSQVLRKVAGILRQALPDMCTIDGAVHPVPADGVNVIDLIEEDDVPNDRYYLKPLFDPFLREPHELR